MEKNVSIIIPCRDEEKFIGKCLDSIISQDFPKESLEVLVVNGASEDRTEEIVRQYSLKHPLVRLLENPQKFTPFGLNIGIKEAKGRVIIRMDAHAGYSRDYVSKCVSHLEESGADNVGGAVRTLPARDTLIARAIALSLSNRFGAASDFRIGTKEAKEVDTVFGGCFPREIFNKVGFFNEKLKRSQDLEFNLRIRKSGGRILLFPDIVVEYYPQPTLSRFFRHNVEDGIWSILPLKFVKTKFKLRHYIPLIFVGSLLGSGILSLFSWKFFLIFWMIVFFYGFLNIFFSFGVALKERDPRFLLLMPLAFIARHFGYGLGSIWGLIKLIK
ncbi:MAG: glycosyltransferase family 2 protein [bacterium]|nr:glycosyltransferase family 2 protein [bacterium]